MTAEMIAKLEAASAEIDARMLEGHIAQSEAAYKRFKAWDEANPCPRGDAIWEHYRKAFDVAGGKGNYDAMRNGLRSYLTVCEKKARKTFAARNAKIVATLAKYGIHEIGNVSFSSTKDGFQSITYVDGKTVDIRYIIAGGYNIQCLHTRFIAKVY